MGRFIYVTLKTHPILHSLSGNLGNGNGMSPLEGIVLPFLLDQKSWHSLGSKLGMVVKLISSRAVTTARGHHA